MQTKACLEVEKPPNKLNMYYKYSRNSLYSNQNQQ